LAWYAGTANITGSKLPSENGDTIYRRLGDLDENNIADATKPWYTPDHTNASFTHGNEKAPWEGIGTGWFHAVLEGGSIFESPKNWVEGLLSLSDWLKDAISVFPKSCGTIIRWIGEIIAYLDRRTTQGVVEGINNKLKLIKRKGYGFRNFDNFILRSFLH
jgi:hypothetical protein